MIDAVEFVWSMLCVVHMYELSFRNNSANGRKDIRELNHDEVAAMYRLGLDHIYISGGAVDCRCGAIPR